MPKRRIDGYGGYIVSGAGNWSPVQAPAAKPNKYGNVKVEVDGRTFDSRKEAGRYAELRLLEKGGVISDLKMQQKFTLIPSQYVDGKCVEKPCVYKADFVYRENGCVVVEDVKSPATRTKEYVIKRKLMLQVYGIRIREV